MDLSNLVGNVGFAASIYYGGVVIIAIFLAGFYLRSKLSKLCEESTIEINKRMDEMELRLTKHETEAVTISNYDKDMNNVREMFIEIKRDVKEGFMAINLRIDAILRHGING